MRQPQEAAASPVPLVATLRELRERTGLSLAALATRTPYSKSAWHRYLSGAKHPPRSAVEALARLAGADPAPVLALWEAWDGTGPAVPAQRGAAVPGAPGGSGRPPVRRRRLPLLPALTLLTAAAAVATALAASSRGASPGSRAGFAPVRCHGRSCQGELPGASACARDAQTSSAVSDATYTVRLRWSPSCHTAWSQVGVRGAVAREISVRTGEDVLSAAYPARDTASDTSPMLAVSSPRGVEACAEVNGEVACTGLDADAGGEP
ncbi:helix-turn-helix domain-containing protein [Streptomyces sp. NRRL S-340]|uniref:helix-turn-helix domain-containing protein n=1 Tax=Streptomyces sp. NRRL S-340 TaxID=1463901 RepID=UPI00099B331B|nr:XRE family transcriptional regulator [Streptomyces sp. NRRL S-340]